MTKILFIKKCEDIPKGALFENKKVLNDFVDKGFAKYIEELKTKEIKKIIGFVEINKLKSNKQEVIIWKSKDKKERLSKEEFKEDFWLLPKELEKFKNFIKEYNPKQDFKKLISSLEEVSRKEELKTQAPFINALGFDPMIVYVHAWHESGNFKHIIGNYNFWGIKCPKAWTGKKILITTHEYINGVKTEVQDWFIDFSDMKGAIIWYADFISRMYPQAYAMRANYKGYFPALVTYKNIYASDPEYSKKLVALYEELKPIDYIS